MKAIVFVDVQKDFIDGALKNEKAIETTPKIVEFAGKCAQKGYKLYATRDTHQKTEYKVLANGDDQADKQIPATGYLATLEGEKLPVEHCVEGTDGWMIDDRLMEVIDGKATIVNKPTFGSFDLAEIIEEDLKAWDDKNYFDEIVLAGFVTSICVAANAILLRAKFPNTKITIMKDLCAGVGDEDHNAALKVLSMQQIDIE